MPLKVQTAPASTFLYANLLSEAILPILVIGPDAFAIALAVGNVPLYGQEKGTLTFVTVPGDVVNDAVATPLLIFLEASIQ